MSALVRFHEVVARCLSAFVLAALVQGCAHVYVDEDGSKNILGLLWLKLPAASSQASAGESLRTVSLGLTLTRSEAGSALVLGYSDSTMAFVRNHSLVPVDALLPRRATMPTVVPAEKVDDTKTASDR